MAEAAREAGAVDVIATDIDDLPPEYVEPLRQAVLAAGAVDCQVWPTHGKKGRVSLRLEALAPPAAAEAVTSAVFAHSTTAGVRRWRTTRSTLPRRDLTVELAQGSRIRIKVWEAPTGTRCKPEYGDVVRVAAELGRPALEVEREARHRAEVMIGNGQPGDASTEGVAE